MNEINQTTLNSSVETLAGSTTLPMNAEELIMRTGKLFGVKRLDAKITTDQLSAISGIKAEKIYEFENGQTDIDIQSLILMLEAIDVSIGELLKAAENADLAI